MAIRLAVGTALAAVYAASGQIAGAIGTVTVGIAAPKILEQLARRTPAAQPPRPAPEHSAAHEPEPDAPTKAASEEGAFDAR